MKKYRLLNVVVFLVFPLLVSAQTDWGKQYESAKLLVDEARYDAAVQVLKPLIKEEAGNGYALYSQYLYSYALLQLNRNAEARDMLLQLKQKHTEWKEYNKVSWLLATTYAQLGEYRKSVALIQTIPSSNAFLEEWKTEYYPLIKPFDTLLAIHRSTPLDAKLAEVLYGQIIVKPEAKYKPIVVRLEKEYGFKPPAKERKPFKNVVKEKYHMAALFPFQWKEINLSETQRSNQYVIDLYAGMKIAMDSLNKDKKAAPIELHAYDTEKDVAKVAQVVKYNEWKSIDLVFGPLFPEQYNYIKNLPEVETKTLVNPLSANGKYAEAAGSYLYKASIESTVSCLANYAANNFVLRKNVPKDPGTVPKKNVLILYGREIKDSVLAYQYRDTIIAKGFTVKKIMKVDLNYMGTLRTIASDSVGLLSISHVLTLTNDAVFAANFISLMEVTKQQIPIYAYSEWLDNSQLSYVQMDKRGVHFIFPDYIRSHSPSYQNFHKAYVAKYNVFPSIYVIEGFEMAMIFGKALRAKGTDVSLYLNERKFFVQGMTGGYNYAEVSYNKFLPIVAFKDLKLHVVNE